MMFLSSTPRLKPSLDSGYNNSDHGLSVIHGVTGTIMSGAQDRMYTNLQRERDYSWVNLASPHQCAR